MDEMTACLQENMELYAENERLYQEFQSLKAKMKKQRRKREKKPRKNELRDKKIIELRNRNWTLQEIADEYGITRERVRQIVGNSDYENKKTTRRKAAVLAHPDLTNDEIAEILDIHEGTISSYRAGTRYSVKGGALKIGIEKEDEYAEKLQNMGMDVELMPYMHEFDALVNGWRVDFKYSKSPKNAPSMKNVNPAWRFQVKKGEKYRERCDFFFCITANDDVFIIPSDAVPEKMSQLVFCYPVAKVSKGKWQAYRDRYDLLETPKHEAQS